MGATLIGVILATALWGGAFLINQAYMFKFNLNTIRSYMRASMDVLYKLPEGPMALESFGEL